jgi:hypothetical protein
MAITSRRAGVGGRRRRSVLALATLLILLPLASAPTALADEATIEMPLAAVTGQPFTIRPVYPAGFTIAPDDVCRTEFRWGDDSALFSQQSNNTFGGILFEGPASEGFCGEWTFTLPWVPYRQYALDFTGPDHHSIQRTFTAKQGSSDPHITTSNLPLVYVLPKTKDVVVGQPLTFTLYRLNGAGAGEAGQWVGTLVGSGATTGTGVVFHQTGGSSFTFTPTRTGYWEAGWNPTPGYPWVLSGYYDPAVKRAPSTPKPPAPTVAPTVPPTPTPVPVTPPPTSKVPMADPELVTPNPSALTAMISSVSPGPTEPPADPGVPAPGPAVTQGPDGLLIGLASLVVLAGLLVALGVARLRLRAGRDAGSDLAARDD